ncbi:MAG: hypothetical protein A2Y57_01240 [Candidatus Woykebacteria bacterium RBG_13_40_7b]|uniref:Galactose-1-phosphate uridyl transferase N-terminal domain-containing protein n=1 Tax=Candidatus Woykebacteria bacterium RBG_13_40_7b TaxID=1802594 RepID=A0A1G1W9Y5_9BACT|nr:MAG: hypothetical protein A2Y57_01240 [Candidatus Woykebacteria bacterium RBG_13_40_7b]
MEGQLKYIFDKVNDRWVISSPRRAKRPGLKETLPKKFCPFCPGNEKYEKEILRIGEGLSQSAGWQVRVVPNKYPFSANHEIVIHSPDHHKNIDELPEAQAKRIFEVFKNRALTYREEGTVFIFHNHGRSAGESLTHPHSQIVVLPKEVKLNLAKIPEEKKTIWKGKFFNLVLPEASQYSYEVWFIRSAENKLFYEASDEEIQELVWAMKKVLNKLSKKFGAGFSFNFYIYPYENWYLRVVPRSHSIGGLEVGTGIFVNSADSEEVEKFLKTAF